MSKRKTKEEFQNELNCIFSDGEFVVLGDYINNQTKIEILHTKCNNTILKRPNKMVSSKEGCYICNKKNKSKNSEYFKREVYEKYKEEYIVLGEYVNAKEKLKVLCTKCHTNFDISPDNLLRGKGCPNCSLKTPIELYLPKLKEMYGDKWVLVGEWNGTSEKTEFKHECGHSRFITPYGLIQKRRKCLGCQNHFSSLHLEVREILESLKIKYEEEFSFTDCRNFRALPFDFYIKELNMCIEVDGKQHYQPSSWFGGDKVFKEITYRDNIKNKFCKTNSINLLRLKYSNKNLFRETIQIYIETLHANTEITVSSNELTTL